MIPKCFEKNLFNQKKKIFFLKLKSKNKKINNANIIVIIRDSFRRSHFDGSSILFFEFFINIIISQEKRRANLKN